MLEIKPIKKSTVVDKIVDQLLGKIINKTLLPGMKLPSENELAESLGVGRSSVREALRVLEALDFLEKTKDGPVICSPGSEFIARWLGINIAVKQIPFSELLEVREVIEVALAGFAAKNIDDSGLSKLKSLTDKMQESANNNDVDTYIKANVEFHVTIADAANNSLLYQVMESVRQALFNFQREIYHSPEVHIASLEQHSSIYKSIKERDPDGARKAMHEHIQYMKGLFASL